jgi:hypothetical protein
VAVAASLRVGLDKYSDSILKICDTRGFSSAMLGLGIEEAI